jgi:hypothetical protein
MSESEREIEIEKAMGGEEPVDEPDLREEQVEDEEPIDVPAVPPPAH